MYATWIPNSRYHREHERWCYFRDDIENVGIIYWIMHSTNTWLQRRSIVLIPYNHTCYQTIKRLETRRMHPFPKCSSLTQKRLLTPKICPKEMHWLRLTSRLATNGTWASRKKCSSEHRWKFYSVSASVSNAHCSDGKEAVAQLFTRSYHLQFYKRCFEELKRVPECLWTKLIYL